MRHKKCLAARLTAAVLGAMIAFTSMDISMLTASAMMPGDSLTAQTADIMPLGASDEDNGDTDTDVAFDERFEQGGEKAWSSDKTSFTDVPLNQEFGNSPRTQRYLFMTYPDTYYRAIAMGDKGLGIADDAEKPIMVVNEGDKQGDRTLKAGEYARKKDPYLRLLSGEDNKVKKEFNEEYGYFYLPDYSNKDDGNFGASDTQCIFYIDGDTTKVFPSKDENGRTNKKSLWELNGGSDNGPLYGFERAQNGLVFYTANAAVWKALWANNCYPCVLLRDAAFDYKEDRSIDIVLRITDAECSDRSREAKGYVRPDGTEVKGRCFMKIMGGALGSRAFNRLRVGAGNCAWVKSSIEFYDGKLSGDIPKKESGDACKSLEEILQVKGLEVNRDNVFTEWKTYVKPYPARLTGLMTYKDCDIGELFSPQEGFDPVIYGTYGALSGAENMIVTNGKSSIRANGGSATSYYTGEPKGQKSYRVLFSRSGVGGTANGYEENSCNKFTMSFTDQTSISYVSGFMAKGNADIDEDGFAVITNDAGGWFSSSGPGKVAFHEPKEQVSSLKSLLDYRTADDPDTPEIEPFFTADGPKDFDRAGLSEEEKQALIEQSGDENLDFEPPLDPVPDYSYTGKQSMFVYKITQYIPYLNVNDKDVAKLASLTLENVLPKYVDVVSCYLYTTAKPEDKQKAAVDAAMGNSQEPGYFSWNPSTTEDGRKKVMVLGDGVRGPLKIEIS